MKATTILAAVIFSAGFSSAHAQSANQPAGGLPKACQAAAQASGHKPMIDKMQAQMDQAMQGGMQGMGQMTETQTALHQAMIKMHGPMMQGMMAQDADVAWICSMIPHHQGAIDMARAGLKGADNAESKRMADETIKSNEKEKAKLIAWVEKHAESESRKTTGSK